MLRFLSKRMSRSAQKYKTVAGQDVAARGKKPSKHSIQCKVILLDGTDLTYELPVSILIYKYKANLILDTIQT